MPTLSSNKWLHRRKWQRLIACLLIALFSHPLASVQAQVSDISNRATSAYTVPGGLAVETNSNLVTTGLNSTLIDPGGEVLGCDGQPLSSYVGFEMRLYEPDASGLDIDTLVPLNRPANPNLILPGLPNPDNNNPSLITSTGRYNFLLDDSVSLTSPINAGLVQTDVGAQYILVIDPPDSSRFAERRVRISVTDSAIVDGRTAVLGYSATSLDSQPILADGNSVDRVTEVRIDSASVQSSGQSSVFFGLELDTAICEADQIRINKSADRSAAQPGDIVVYRLNITNSAGVEVDAITAIDTLPTGFELVEETVAGQVAERPVEVSAQRSGNTVTFRAVEVIAPDQSLDIIYATRLTPDALRGSGQNSVIVTAQRTDSGFRIQDGPSVHRITLDPSILADCGTLIGRVFEDKNFDGEQQNGEAGIPNAVIFLDDGNRVVTDGDGLFSVQKMLPGQRTGTLDLSSLPGYTLAPNLRFIERNSYSRLVNLAPGSLVRMNFGVTPTFQEAQE